MLDVVGTAVPHPPGHVPAGSASLPPPPAPPPPSAPAASGIGGLDHCLATNADVEPIPCPEESGWGPERRPPESPPAPESPLDGSWQGSPSSVTLVSAPSPCSSIRRPLHLSPGRAARLAGRAVISLNNRDPAAPPPAPVRRVYLHMSTQPISRRLVKRVLLCQGLPLLLVSLQTWLYLSRDKYAFADGLDDTVFGIAFATLVLGVQALCFHRLPHLWLVLVGLGVPTVWQTLVSLLQTYHIWAIPGAASALLQVAPYVLFSLAAVSYTRCTLRRGADVVEAVPGVENTPLLFWGFSVHRIVGSLLLMFSLGPILWVWYTFYTILLEIMQNVLWKQCLVMLVKAAVDIVLEAIYVRISRVVPSLFYYDMFYFYAVKCSFSLLGLRSLSNVVSLVISESVLVSPVLLYLLFLVPFVSKQVSRLGARGEVSNEHICCYLSMNLLAQFTVYLLVIPSTVLYIVLPTDSLAIGRQMGPHTYFMLGAACLRMLWTCVGAHAVVMRHTGLSVLGGVQDMILCEPVYILGTLLFASCQGVIAQESARVFVPLLADVGA